MKRARRKLFLALALLILMIAGIAWSVYRARLAQEQADFLASVTSSGGSIVMDYEDDGQAASRMPLWLRGLWGDWPYAHVVKVKTSTSPDFRVLGEFARLRELEFSSTGLWPVELSSLRNCKHLRVLNLRNCPWDVEHPPDFPELEVLDLSGAIIPPRRSRMLQAFASASDVAIGQFGY